MIRTVYTYFFIQKLPLLLEIPQVHEILLDLRLVLMSRTLIRRAHSDREFVHVVVHGGKSVLVLPTAPAACLLSH